MQANTTTATATTASCGGAYIDEHGRYCALHGVAHRAEPIFLLLGRRALELELLLGRDEAPLDCIGGGSSHRERERDVRVGNEEVGDALWRTGIGSRRHTELGLQLHQVDELVLLQGRSGSIDDGDRERVRSVVSHERAREAGGVRAASVRRRQAPRSTGGCC